MISNKISFQIVMSTQNNDDTILDCLESIECSMNEFNKEVKWILLIGDGDSTDNTLVEIGKYAENTSADKIHLFDYQNEEKSGINENKLIKEAQAFGEDYPLILFMDPKGKMTTERPMMVFTALTYDAPWVVGAWRNADTPHSTNYAYDSKEAAKWDYYGYWATLFDIDFLAEQDKLFYESINKGRDVLAWKQLKHCQNIRPVAHVRTEDPVHQWIDPARLKTAHEEKRNQDESGAQIIFKCQTEEKADNSGMNPDLNPEDFEEESKLFLKMKMKLEGGCDILKDAVE